MNFLAPVEGFYVNIYKITTACFDQLGIFVCYLTKGKAKATLFYVDNS